MQPVVMAPKNLCRLLVICVWVIARRLVVGRSCGAGCLCRLIPTERMGPLQSNASHSNYVGAMTVPSDNCLRPTALAVAAKEASLRSKVIATPAYMAITSDKQSVALGACRLTAWYDTHWLETTYSVVNPYEYRCGVAVHMADSLARIPEV